MRRHRNKIQALLDPQGDYIYDCDRIKEEAIAYYQVLFNGDSNVFFPNITTRMQINNMGKEYLASPVTMYEVKAAPFSIDDTKSLGPNGFSSKLYKLHWDVLP